MFCFHFFLFSFLHSLLFLPPLKIFLLFLLKKLNLFFKKYQPCFYHLATFFGLLGGKSISSSFSYSHYEIKLFHIIISLHPVHVSAWMESNLLATYCLKEGISAKKSRYLSNTYLKITHDSLSTYWRLTLQQLVSP